MNDDLKIIREVNAQAEAFYAQAVELGNHAAHVLGDNHRAQMTSLENIADGAFKTSDIFDYIKKQTARFDFWRKGWAGNEETPPVHFDGQTPPQEMFGKRLLVFLKTGIEEKRCQGVCSRLGIDNKTPENRQRRRKIALLLMRQFIRQMVVQYEYASKVERIENGAQR